MEMTARKNNIVDHINARLKDWYINAKENHDVEGKGECAFLESNETLPCGTEIYDFVIKYSEEGEDYIATHSICDEYIYENNIDWLFNIWMDGGMVVANLKDLK